MKRALLAASLAFASCAPTLRSDGTRNCQVGLAGDFNSRFAHSPLTQEAVDDAVDRAIAAAAYVTDWRFNDQTANCQALVGFRIYTVDQPVYDLEWYGQHYVVAGHTVCGAKYMVVGVPRSGDWLQSALVHEMYHAMQNCNAPKPIDEGEDEAHANWRRANIYFAIDKANKP